MTVTIVRTLKGTSFKARVELDEIEYQHFLLAEGRRPDASMPMDIEVMRKVIALAEHFERPALALLIEDEARDAAEMVF